MPLDKKTNLKTFFEPSGKGSSQVCSYIFTDIDSENQRVWSKAQCHASALLFGNKTTDGMYSSIWSHDKCDADRRFAEFIHSKERSPWKSLFTDGHYYNFEEGYYFIPVTDDTPHQLLCNFAVANRHFHEKYENIKHWAWLQDECGFSDIEALYLLSFHAMDNDYQLVQTPGGHYPFHHQYRTDWTRLSTGTPLLDPTKLTHNIKNLLSRNSYCLKTTFEYWDAGSVKNGYLEMNLPWCCPEKNFGVYDYTTRKAPRSALMDLFYGKGNEYDGNFPLLHRKMIRQGEHKMLPREKLKPILIANKEKFFA